MFRLNRASFSGEFFRYAVLALIPCLLYLKSVRYDFLLTWDDASYILNNPLVHGLSVDRFISFFARPFFSNYAPFHLLTCALEYTIWGDHAAGYHLVNILVHAANVCLVYRLVRTLTANEAVAFWSALLFAIHPVNVESVAWVSESKTLFAHLFCLLTVNAYMLHRRSGKTGVPLAALVFFLSGLLFKVSIAPLPLFLLAWELIMMRAGQPVKAIAPFFLASGIVGALAVWAQGTGTIDPGLLDPDFLFGTVYPSMVPLFWKYLGLLLVPLSQSGYYDAELRHSFLDPRVLASIAGILLAGFLLVRKGSPQVRLWTVWYVLFLLPVSNILPLPVYYADRYLYTPSVGFFVLLALGFRELRTSWPDWSRKAAAPVLSALVLVLIIAAFTRLDVWRNDLTFWEDTARKSPGLYKPHLNLGAAYEQDGRLDEAEREYLQSIEIRPTDAARYNLAMIQAKREYVKQQQNSAASLGKIR